MSVRVSDRNQSKVEYIYNAQQMCYLVRDRITKYANKVANSTRYKHFTKSSDYSVWNSPIYHAQMVYQYCQLANRERDTIKRLDYLSNAGRNLELLETSTQTFYDKYRKIVKDKFMVLLATHIKYQKDLLKGCIKLAKSVSCSQPLPPRHWYLG